MLYWSHLLKLATSICGFWLIGIFPWISCLILNFRNLLWGDSIIFKPIQDSLPSWFWLYGAIVEFILFLRWPFDKLFWLLLISFSLHIFYFFHNFIGNYDVPWFSNRTETNIYLVWVILWIAWLNMIYLLPNYACCFTNVTLLCRYNCMVRHFYFMFKDLCILVELFYLTF